MKKLSFFLVSMMLVVAFSTNAQTTENLLAAGHLNDWTMYVDGADVNPATVYKLNNGILRIEGQPFGFIRTNKTYENFVLIAQWRWVGTASNSGIFLFTQEELRNWPHAIEVQLRAGRAGELTFPGGSSLENSEVVDGRRRPIPLRHDSSEKPEGEWNTAVITAMNGNLSVVINGVLQSEGIGAVNKSGHIALQSEGGPLEFRNVLVTTIP
jgi:hypothetical protein